jgi:hypothetical protein
VSLRVNVFVPVRYWQSLRECGEIDLPTRCVSYNLFKLWTFATDVAFGIIRCSGARSSTDRVADFESEGCRFESYRARFTHHESWRDTKRQNSLF